MVADWMREAVDDARATFKEDEVADARSMLMCERTNEQGSS
jgi:hypothetical protein